MWKVPDSEQADQMLGQNNNNTTTNTTKQSEVTITEEGVRKTLLIEGGRSHRVVNETAHVSLKEVRMLGFV